MKTSCTLRENLVQGVTTGLISLNESVTWRARHCGVYQELTSKITDFERPEYFVDEMTKGVFYGFKHEHFFKAIDDQTLMTDIFNYKTPLGILGRMADILF